MAPQNVTRKRFYLFEAEEAQIEEMLKINVDPRVAYRALLEVARHEGEVSRHGLVDAARSNWSRFERYEKGLRARKVIMLEEANDGDRKKYLVYKGDAFETTFANLKRTLESMGNLG
jgi:hypothetical protein